MLFPKKIFLQFYHALIYHHLLHAIPYEVQPTNLSILQNKAVGIGYPGKMEFQGKPFIYQPKSHKTEQTLLIWSW